MLADNFPAKTFLLVTHLTEHDPGVSSFSSDGASFEIYDQATLAKKFLPQYFKHANYGSFARQLNLYGFTSSRLKENPDVIVWMHELFRRDHKELLKDIKRGKKAKVAPASIQTNTDTRSPSPPSITDDISSDYSNMPRKMEGAHGFDHVCVWMKSEFAFLQKQNLVLEQKLVEQNKCIEQKLDTLLTLTLHISPASNSETQVSCGKRRRQSPIESDGPTARELGYPVETRNTLHDQLQLQSVQEKRRSSVWTDSYNIEPLSYSNGVSRKMPPEATEYEPQDIGDSGTLRKFVDVMLSDDDDQEREVGRPMYAFRSENTESNRSHATHAHSAAMYPPRLHDELYIENDLLAEAMNAMLPCDSSAFGDEVGGESTSQQERENRTHELVTFSNAAAAKSDPQPIQNISYDVPNLIEEGGDIEEGPYMSSSASGASESAGDIEEGHSPGDYVIHAELVEEYSRRGSTTSTHWFREHLRDRSDRRMMLGLVAFVGIILAVGVTVMAVLFTQQDSSMPSSNQQNNTQVLTDIDNNVKLKADKGERHPPPPPRTPCPDEYFRDARDGGGCVHKVTGKIYHPSWDQTAPILATTTGGNTTDNGIVRDRPECPEGYFRNDKNLGGGCIHKEKGALFYPAWELAPVFDDETASSLPDASSSPDQSKDDLGVNQNGMHAVNDGETYADDGDQADGVRQLFGAYNNILDGVQEGYAYYGDPIPLTFAGADFMCTRGLDART